MASISTMAAFVTANISGFTAGMREAGEHADSFGERFKHVAEGVLEAAALLGVGFSVEGVVEYLKHTFDTIEATERLSQTLGVTTDAIGKLDYAAQVAGVSQESLHSGIQKMLKALDQARDGNKGAVEAFGKLGLSAKDFAGLNAHEAFIKIAGSMSNAEDRASALHAAVTIFGRGAGGELIPLLRKGSDELEKLGDEAVQSGYALSQIDSEKVALAGEAIRRVQADLQGLANVLIVQLAPFIEAVGDELHNAIAQGDGAHKLVDVFEVVVTGAATAADYLKLFEAGWYALNEAAAIALLTLSASMDALQHMYAGVASLFGHKVDTTFFDSLTADLKRQVDEIGAKGSEALDVYASGKLSKAAADEFDKLRQHSNELATDLAKTVVSGGDFGDEIAKESDKGAKAIEELQHKLESFGKSKSEALGIKLKAEGASDQEIKEAKALQDQIDHLEAAKKAQDEMTKSASKLAEETRSPLEKFQKELDSINDLYAEGAIDIDTYSRAINKAEDDLEKATKQKEKFHHLDVDAPHLLEAGGADAANFVAKFQAQAKENEHEKQIAENTKKSHDTQLAMLHAMEDAALVTVLAW